MLNADARRARARLAAHRRWHPGEDLDQLTEDCLLELAQSRADGAIDDLVALADKMTTEQLTRIRRLAATR